MKSKKMSIRSLNENIQNIRLWSQIYIKNVKNVSNSHCTLYIRNFLSLENVEILMQVSNWQLFHCNDIDKDEYRNPDIFDNNVEAIKLLTILYLYYIV